MIDLVEAGYIEKPHGLRGEIRIEVEEVFAPYIRKTKSFFTYIDGCPVPFFIESWRSADHVFVKLQDITTPEQAKEICGQTLYVDRSMMPKGLLKKIGKQHDQKNIIGYTCLDQTSGTHSEVIGIEEFPGQLMACIEYKGMKKYFPLHADWIANINHNKKEITLLLPEGLLDL